MLLFLLIRFCIYCLDNSIHRNVKFFRVGLSYLKISLVAVYTYILNDFIKNIANIHAKFYNQIIGNTTFQKTKTKIVQYKYETIL